MYRNYEEYMQTVLGYNSNSNTYNRDMEGYLDVIQVNPNMQELNKFYPDIYGLVYPVVQNVCRRRNIFNLTEQILSEMVEEVYNVIEPGNDLLEIKEEPLKNGDVRNPRAKEVKESRQNSRRNNQLMRDLIRILILRELLQGGRPGFYPGRPRKFPWRARRKTSYATETTISCSRNFNARNKTTLNIEIYDIFKHLSSSLQEVSLKREKIILQKFQ